jgi:hypothetical protein
VVAGVVVIAAMITFAWYKLRVSTVQNQQNMPPPTIQQPGAPPPILGAPRHVEDKFNSTSPYTQADVVETGGGDMRGLRYPDETLNDVNVPSGRLESTEN